jgi:GNAT superfamily N-acetyltransferase
MRIENPNESIIQRADASDSAALAAIDSNAAAGDAERVAKIRVWCEQGSTLVANGVSGPLGYIVLEYTFFDQGFVTMLMVAPHARRRGIRAQLLEAAAATCTTEKALHLHQCLEPCDAVGAGTPRLAHRRPRPRPGRERPRTLLPP